MIRKVIKHTLYLTRYIINFFLRDMVVPSIKSKSDDYILTKVKTSNEIFSIVYESYYNGIISLGKMDVSTESSKLARFNNHSIYGINGLIINQRKEISYKGYINDSEIEQIGLYDPGYLKGFIYKPKKLYYDKVVLVSVIGSRGYYHWFTDVLGRLQLIENYDDVDAIVFNVKDDSFYKETLIHLGIYDKCFFTESNTEIIAKEIIRPISSFSSNKRNKETYLYLREAFSSLSINHLNNKVLYVSRAKASRRRLVNERYFIAHLKQKYDITFIYAEELSFTEQVRLFSSHKIIISPHGAGLTNMLFANPETILIELMPNDYQHIGYLRMTDSIGIRHNIIVVDSVNKLNDMALNDQTIKYIDTIITEHI